MFPTIAADNVESNLDEMVDMRLRSDWLLADIQSCSDSGIMFVLITI